GCRIRFQRPYARSRHVPRSLAAPRICAAHRAAYLLIPACIRQSRVVPLGGQSMQRFAFMIHPLKVKDIARKFPLANIMPESVLEGLFRRVPPLTVSKITGIRSATGAEAEGWFVACPMTARQMVELPEKVVLDKIIQTGRKAEELGAPLLGLGAFTAVVGDAGITVARALGIPVTTGNSYTVATALEGIEYAANLLGQDLQ